MYSCMCMCVRARTFTTTKPVKTSVLMSVCVRTFATNKDVKTSKCTHVCMCVHIYCKQPVKTSVLFVCVCTFATNKPVKTNVLIWMCVHIYYKQDCTHVCMYVYIYYKQVSKDKCTHVCMYVYIYDQQVCKDKYRLEPVWLYNVKLSLESWCVHVVWKHTYKWNELWIRIYEHYYHHPHPTQIITKWTLNLTNECTTVVWRNYYLALDNKMCMTWIYRHNKFKLIYIYEQIISHQIL